MSFASTAITATVVDASTFAATTPIVASEVSAGGNPPPTEGQLWPRGDVVP